MSSFLLQMRGIEKTYPGVQALKGVDFDLHAGEIHCLVGENGAGKSTLIRILSGAETPDAGEIKIAGRGHRSMDPSLAHALGIGVIHQEADLVLPMTVAENIFLGHELARGGIVPEKARMGAAVSDLMQKFNLNIPLDVPVRELGPAQWQLVQIAKALSRAIRILVLDEPTAALTDNEITYLCAPQRGRQMLAGAQLVQAGGDDLQNDQRDRDRHHLAEACQGLGVWLTFYNEDWPHQALGYCTPCEVHETTA